MSWDDFRKLSLIDKARSLYLHGTFITSIRYYKHKVNLYLIGDYYVEVFYNPKVDRVEYIERLQHTHSRMKFYSDQVKLPNF
ncbi:MAG: hypothetical protein AAGF85_06400 [Bacteroidota bacterium]